MAELRSWQPGYIDRLKYGIAGLMGDDRQSVRDAEKITSLLEYVPGVGDAMAGAEAVDEFNAGNYGTAGLLGAAAAAGLVPGVGDAAAQGIKKGIRAYHGSPHDFDKFDMSKIGTGEGAQAYGPGLYFAEREGVAKSYRDALSGRNYRMAGASDEVANKFGQDVVDIFEASGGDRGEISNTLARLQNQVTRGLQDAGVNNISKLDDSFNPLFVADIKATNDRAERLAAFLRSDYAQLDPGHMYEVNINANPDDFLDWDKPLSEQPKVVQDFANARWQQIYGRGPDPSIEGEYISKMASPQHGIDDLSWLDTGPAADASRRMREAGIPGIKYLDAGSRSAGDGSRNYVVFDDALIEILRKYGIAGLSLLGAGGAAYNAEQDGPAPLL